MLYLYALSEPPTILPSMAGLDESVLAVEHLGAIDAIVSVVDSARIEPTDEAVLGHAGVVDALAAANAAVLPARFGRGFGDATALRSAVAERSTELQQALARVRGCAELAVRVLAPTNGGRGAVESGGEYMRARLDDQRRTDRLAEELHAPLASLARAATKSVGASPELLLSGTYLVPRDALDRFEARVAELGADHPELTLACTGPWPPYSFATAEPGGS